MSRIKKVQAPRQKLSFKQKTKEWRKQNLDYADNFTMFHNEEIRQSLRNKMINLNLYNGIVDVRDLTNVVNPNNIDASYVPDNIPHNPIIVPKIDLLVGEESKRRFDYFPIVTDPNSISRKLEDRKKFLMERLTAMLQENYTDEELEQKMNELGKYMKYSYMDLREKMAMQILKYYYNAQKFEEKFNEGFKHALIMAEELYLIDISFNEPRLTLLNPLKVALVGTGGSNLAQDASIVIIEDYKSPNQLVDEYHDELKTSDLDYLFDYTSRTGKGSYTDDDNNHTLLRDGLDYGIMYDDMISLAEMNGHIFGSNHTDANGNIRELKVRWKSLRKIQKIKFYDEYGEVQYRFESEEYIPIKELGEESTTMWVNEGWEGVKIGKDIYIKMRPMPVQYISMNNPSRGHLGVVGRIYNTNQGRGVSLIDRGKNHQYMYDAVYDRLNKAIAANYGKLLELDLSKVPEGWEIEKWLHFAVVNKIAVVDSFNEGKKGQATGKLAGAFNTQGGRVMDMETGAYIQQHIQLLEFIKLEMGEICGVSRQREGQISNRETVGGVERSVNQSSHVTEFWFKTHESVKLDVLTAFLEAAKIALKGDKRKVQYILDDQTIEVLNIDGEELLESDFAITIGSTSKMVELEQVVKQHTQSYLQNGGNLSTVMDIYFSPSLLDMRRRLEQAEEEQHQRASEAQQQQAQAQQEEYQRQAEFRERQLQLQDLLNQRDNETRITIEQMKLGADSGETPSIDDGISPLDEAKFQLDVTKTKQDYLTKMKTLQNDMEKHKDNMEAKKVDQSIARIKKKSTT